MLRLPLYFFYVFFKTVRRLAQLYRLIPYIKSLIRPAKNELITSSRSNPLEDKSTKKTTLKKEGRFL